MSINAGAELLFQVQDQHAQGLKGAVLELQLHTDRMSAEDVRKRPAVMDQVDKQFDPHSLLVSVGQQVAFPNSDEIRHHVYSFSRPNQFEIKLYSGESAQPVVFDHAGVVVLGCNIHDRMKGYIYVAESGDFAAMSDVSGRIRFIDVSADDVASVRIWHPDQAQGSATVREVELPEINTQQLRVVIIETAEAPSRPDNTFRSRFKQ